MEARGLLDRMRDARDRRRTLVWLTDDARTLMAKRREVLDRERVDAAMQALSERDGTTLIESLRALVHAARPDARKRKRR
jgi:DNA-binding MarR family transcriptional regulator